jgi:predicted lipid-binding transport protein (Tim44 family)
MCGRASPFLDREIAMKKSLYILITLLCLGLTAMDVDAARRFGGGGNLGRQRPAPTLRETPRETPAATPAPARPAPSVSPTPAPVPRPSFMSRFGGVLAGLGIGALLGSLFSGSGFGGAGGSLLMLLIVALLAFAVIRRFMGAKPAPAGAVVEPAPRQAFSGIGSAVNDEPRAGEPLRALPSGPEPTILAANEVEPFLRVAKTSFIRLQAANDAGDLDDIRDYTTPEMYAEIAMQLRERPAQAQKSEVVALDAELVSTGIDEPYAYASVRFKGELRDAPSGEQEHFDEIWNVRRKLGDPRAPWLIAGIQQAA